MIKKLLLCVLACKLVAMEPEILDLDVISYEAFSQNDPEAFETLHSALYQKGIIGIRGVPGYREKVAKFVETARAFAALPEEVKAQYTPDRDQTIVGYEIGAEKFQRPDGTWVTDDLKVSYYGFVPDTSENIWPHEVELQAPFQEIATLMRKMGQEVMTRVGLISPASDIYVDHEPALARMLHYRKSGDTGQDNPYWCGSHFDHGMFTVLLPSCYFADGKNIPEPLEAGLYVKTTHDGVFKKVKADDPDVMLFQVGEFAQLASNDMIRATEHRVQKADGNVERFTLALFFNAPADTLLHSTSELTADARYGGSGRPCTYERWNHESLNRYLVEPK